MQLFPSIAKTLIADIEAFEKKWTQICSGIAEFYMQAQGLHNTPVWYVDELDLNEKRQEIVDQYLRCNSFALLCYLDRVVAPPKNAFRFQASRSLVMQNDIIVRNDWPRVLVERPDTPPIAEQLAMLKSSFRVDGFREVVLIDSGFVSGNTTLDVCRWMADIGVPVKKVIGGIGWYPKACENLSKYDPECVIWFDIAKSGWVDTRDYFIFTNTGTPVSETSKSSPYGSLAVRKLQDGTSVGFTIPYIAFGSRWFRTSNSSDTRKLLQICLDSTIKLIDAIDPTITIGRIAKLHEETGSLFLLPVPFGDIHKSLARAHPNTLLADYIDRQFKDTDCGL